MLIEIKHKYSNEVLFSCEAENIKECVKSALKNNADLRCANLSSANLSYADLSYANLRSADLSSANLSSADLSSADLSSANLSSADLSYANLRSVNGLNYSPIQIINTKYFITILNDEVSWGCKKFTFEKLEKFKFEDCEESWDEREFEFNKKTILDHIKFYRSAK